MLRGTFVSCVFVQVSYAKMSNNISVAEYASLTTDAADNSCIIQFIEIVPLDTSRNDFAVRDVKDEFTVDMKVEPEFLIEEYEAFVVNVRW